MMQEQLMETWGYCADCAQWFWIPSDTVRAFMSALCPCCDARPQRLEQRQGDLVISLDVDAAMAGGAAGPSLTGVS